MSRLCHWAAVIPVVFKEYGINAVFIISTYPVETRCLRLERIIDVELEDVVVC